ncbi:Hypothetical protein AJAP_27955 [Amycolatopsis japonica]|uniref:Uncharacterized protein n=1 Tax=Amycolatopsis japonica TaxID=208439 RepID=A0A075V185_9PSEU|nr:Hypothetical protein AJAP_27955 [Amycolatopsis japonica]
MLNRANPGREYRILVRYDPDDPRWHKIYEGPWNRDAVFRYHHNVAAESRIQAVLTTAEVDEVFVENYSLALLDAWLNEMYPLEVS